MIYRNPDRKFERYGIDLDNEEEKKFDYILDSKPIKLDIDGGFTPIEKTLIAAAAVTFGFMILPYLKDVSCDVKHIYKNSSLISISNHEMHIYDNVPIEEITTSKKYSITELNDQNWLIYVYGSDASEYSEFIASNIYFDENNKVILDTLKLTDENFEYFINNENTNDGNQRVRRG